jgi:hypothetical protein
MIGAAAEESAIRAFGSTPTLGQCSLCEKREWVQDEDRQLCPHCNQILIPASTIRDWGDSWKGEPAAVVYATLLALQRRLDALLGKP